MPEAPLACAGRELLATVCPALFTGMLDFPGTGMLDRCFPNMFEASEFFVGSQNREQAVLVAGRLSKASSRTVPPSRYSRRFIVCPNGGKGSTYAAKTR